MNLPAPLSEQPAKVERVASFNSMCDREADLYAIVEQSACVDQSTPTVELKHGAPRVVCRPAAPKSKGRARGRRYKGSTSCLLPASKMLLLEPHVPEPRYLTGAEALALQGIPFCYTTNSDVEDADLIHVAGNAFSGGCAAMVFLAGLRCSDFPDDEDDMVAVFAAVNHREPKF